MITANIASIYLGVKATPTPLKGTDVGGALMPLLLCVPLPTPVPLLTPVGMLVLATRICVLVPLTRVCVLFDARGCVALPTLEDPQVLLVFQTPLTAAWKLQLNPGDSVIKTSCPVLPLTQALESPPATFAAASHNLLFQRLALLLHADCDQKLGNMSPGLEDLSNLGAVTLRMLTCDLGSCLLYGTGGSPLAHI